MRKKVVQSLNIAYQCIPEKASTNCGAYRKCVVKKRKTSNQVSLLQGDDHIARKNAFTHVTTGYETGHNVKQRPAEAF